MPHEELIEEFYLHMLKSTPVLNDFERACLKLKVIELLNITEQRVRGETIEEIRHKITTYKNYYNPIGDDLNKGKHMAMEELFDHLSALNSKI